MNRLPARQKKAFPWGLCPAQRIEIFMTAGGSHTIPKWHANGVTDEVEGHSVVPTHGDY